MQGAELPKTREMVMFDHERGKVGWARWRSRKKQATAKYRRRNLDKNAICDSTLEGDSNG